MRTMYRVEERVYTDCEGRHSDWYKVSGSKYVETIAEAEAIAKNVKTDFPHTGDWCIVERIIDEQTFEVVETIVKQYNYYKEVVAIKEAKKQAGWCIKAIEELEASKKRCRTEKGIARKDAEIAKYKKWLENVQKVLAEK